MYESTIHFDSVDGAKCLEIPLEEVDEIFFNEDEANPEATAKAKAICASCPLVETCLIEALKPNKLTQLSTTGIWGGSTTEERAIIRRNKPKLIELHLTKLIEEYGEKND
jgi:hypothetical protein